MGSNKRLLNKHILFITLCISLSFGLFIFNRPVIGQETVQETDISKSKAPNIQNNTQENSTWDSVKQTASDIANVGYQEGSKFALFAASLLTAEAINKYLKKPGLESLFKYIEESAPGQATQAVGQAVIGLASSDKVAGAALLASLYVLYKWYTAPSTDNSAKPVSVDIRPKTFRGFRLLLAESDQGVEIMTRFNYQLNSIKSDIENKNVTGLQLIPEIYPDLIKSLSDDQKQYLNDLIRETINKN